MPPVRETRHLWVGNIPESTTEDKLVEYFQRYGRIDSVKILAKRSSDGGLAAFVDFVDIRCAIKAHETPNRVGDRELRTDYNEPVSSSLSRSHGDQGRRYDRGGRGPGDDGYSSRQSDGYPGNYPYKDDGPARRDYDRAERDGGERDNLRLPAEASPDQYHRGSRSAVKRKDSESAQSGSATAVSGSGSESSDSVDSDTESESDSSVSETSKGVKKTTALQIRNLSARPTDATIREGLYHEFKKHGDVGQIKVFGRDSNRHAVVYFRRHEDVVKAIETCRGKMFLGLEMELTPYDDDHYEGSFHRYRRRNEGGGSFGTAEDVYLFNATRTIFVGNIERNTNSSELKRMFERYGEIVDIDIKKQGSNSAYAFIQYLDITHSVEAKKHMNRALMGRNRLKIGFGKGMPTSTVWIGGLGPNVTEQMLERHFQRYGRINRVGLDQQRSYAMISFENIDGSTMAHNDAKDRPVFGKRLRVDYASRESQHFFYDHLARTGQGDGRRYEPSPPPSYRPRGNKNYDDPGMRSRGGMKQANRGSKYHSYDHGYDRGPNFGDGGRGRGHYDEYYRGSGGGGYESDDFGQELREYNVTRERERERERERAREREQDRRQEPLPRRRHYRETGRHELNPDSDGERYYLRGGEHSDVWPGDGGRDRASRESSVEPRDEHRRGDKRRDGDKRRTEDKRAYVKGKYEGHSEDDMELGEKPSTDRKERREKGLRKKPMEARSDKPEFYPSNYEKGSIDGKEKSVSAKRKTKMKDISEGASADEGKLLPEELPSTMESAIEEKVHRSRTEASAEKMTKKVKHKEGKKKRKHKKSPDAIPLDELPPSEIPLGELPPAEVPPENVPPGHIESDGEIQGVGYEPRENTLESRVEKREEMDSEEKKVRKRSNVKSVISERPVLENLEKDRREYRDGRRPRSPSPDDLPGDRVNRKRARSPDRDVERSRVKNAKHVDSIRHSNGNHYDEVKPKRQRESREATPPPPPPPPPPYNARPKPNQHDPRQLPKDEYSVSSSSTDASVPAPPSVVGHSAPSRSSRDIQTFKPQITDTSPSASSGTTKHVTTGQPLAHASPTNSPAAAQTGNGSVPNSDDTLMELLRRHPVMWQGLLGLKNDSAAIQMHYVSGNPKLAEFSLPKASGGTGANGLPIPPVLRIAQRMRMEASQLEGVTKRMQLDKEHCLLLALPCGRDPLDVHAQTRALKNGFIAYLQQKLAAGIINIAQPGSQQASFVLHVFPPCEFTHSHLSRVAPNLLDSATDSGHLMVVVATV